MGATDFKDFLTAWDALEKISSQDAALIVQETKDVRAEAQAAHEEYSKQEKVAAEEMQRSLELKTDIENKKASLQAEADKITAEVAELHAQEEAQAEAAKAAAAAASRADGGTTRSLAAETSFLATVSSLTLALEVRFLLVLDIAASIVHSIKELT